MARNGSVTAERVSSGLSTLDAVLDDMRALLEARKAECLASADRITDILSTIAPRPRVGRPPKARV